MLPTIFGCKLCGKEHPAIESTDYGVPLLPNTITTEKDNQQRWYFCCVECARARSVPA
jgi:hypothetical protein